MPAPLGADADTYLVDFFVGNHVLMNQFSLLIKPVSGLCNINCSYCFYKDYQDLYPIDESTLLMQRGTLENLVKKFLGLKFPISAFCFSLGSTPSLS